MTKDMPMPDLYYCEKLKASLTLKGCEANRKKPPLNTEGRKGPASREPKAVRPHACEGCEDWKAWDKLVSPQKIKLYSEQRAENMELEQVKRDNANLRVANRQLEDKIVSLVGENVSLSERISVLEKDVLEMTKHYNTACKMLDDYRQDIRGHEAELEKYKELNLTYEQKIQELEKDVLHLTNLHDCARDMSADFRKEIKDLETKIRKIISERDAAFALWHEVFTNSPSMLGILEELGYARGKHPSFAKDLNHAVVILTEEVGEVARAVCEEDPEQARKELKQVGAVVIRMLEETELTEIEVIL